MTGRHILPQRNPCHRFTGVQVRERHGHVVQGMNTNAFFIPLTFHRKALSHGLAHPFGTDVRQGLGHIIFQTGHLGQVLAKEIHVAQEGMGQRLRGVLAVRRKEGQHRRIVPDGIFFAIAVTDQRAVADLGA